MARSRAGGGRRRAPGGSSGGGGGASGAQAVLKFRTRRLSTFRGTEANYYGDESDVGIPYLTDIPAALAETQDVVFDAATQRQQIVRSITCVVPAWADIVTTDTLYDPSSGYYYMIESIQARPGIGYYPADNILTLRMRSGVSIGSA